MIDLSIIVSSFKKLNQTLTVPRKFILQRFKDEVDNIFVNVTRRYNGLHGHYAII